MRPKQRSAGRPQPALWRLRTALLSLSPVRQNLQALIDPLNPPAYPFGHKALSVPTLSQAFSPKVRHEEAHLYSHGREAAPMRCVRQVIQPVVEPDNSHAQAHRLQAVLVRPMFALLPAKGRLTPPPRIYTPSAAFEQLGHEPAEELFGPKAIIRRPQFGGAKASSTAAAAAAHLPSPGKVCFPANRQRNNRV